VLHKFVNGQEYSGANFQKEKLHQYRHTVRDNIGRLDTTFIPAKTTQQYRSIVGESDDLANRARMKGIK
jgi:hypothetical protein